ncbi:MAG: methyltransferase domain-containing protein [Proteobacteria bacterium]|nr:methyltransferase domain-containing protein [Pseudomonadota bacterium]
MTEQQVQKNGDYVLPSSDAETRRLEEQALLYGGVGFLDPLLAEKPREILDIGCGTGHFTRHVAERIPAAMVVGLDIDESRISFARSQSNAPNLKYEKGDLGVLPFEKGRFDLVYSRFVLVHDRDPLKALKEMTRVTSPGGRVAAYDMVHDGIWFSPPKPAFAKLLDTTMNIMRERGAEPNQGLHLPVGMKRAGLEDVQVQVVPHFAMSTDPIFKSYQENWLATVSGLEETLGSSYDKGLIEAAQQELTTRGDEEFLVEITVLAHGKKTEK